MQGHLLAFLGKQNGNELRSRSLESEVISLINREESSKMEISNTFIGYVARSNQAQQEMKYRQDQETHIREEQFKHMRDEIRREFMQIRLEIDDAIQKESNQAWQDKMDLDMRAQREREERDQWKVKAEVELKEEKERVFKEIERKLASSSTTPVMGIPGVGLQFLKRRRRQPNGIKSKKKV